MARVTIRNSMLTRVRTQLRPGEMVEGLFPAATIRDRGRGLTPLEFLPLIVAAEYLAQRRRDRRAGRESLFPLQPRMVMALTDQRVLIWAARLRWRPGRFMGYVTRDRILQVTASAAPTAERTASGSATGTVTVHLANEPPVTLKVPAAAADRLVQSLSGEPSPGRREPR
jgi:hypothetical protein